MVRLPNGSIYLPYDLHAMNDVTADRDLIAGAISWCSSRPGRFLVKMLDNIAAFWCQVENQYRPFEPRLTIQRSLTSTIRF